MVTTSDEVYKHTDKITSSGDIDKGTGMFHKRTEKITTSEEVDNGYEKLEDMKEAVVTISKKDSDKFEVQSKVSTAWFNIDHEFKKQFFYT